MVHHGGFRLQYAEVFNWGTFDKNIWRLEPDGKNTLLTGANGSGKTTLVDAIITLLVPPAKRHYNQSSGSDRKRERDENSYTRGAYSNLQSDSGLTANTQYLRDRDNAYSILIGVFYNAATNNHITLAQVRWYTNHALKRAYFVASQPLDIETHFTPMDTSGAWKRRLKKSTSTLEFDSFAKYSDHFSKAFGLKSEKALSLFSQTVGIKVLGNLNDFIRTNMLEEMNPEEEFVKLRNNYENLLSSYQAIEHARQQLELLQPIVDEGQKHRALSKKVTQLEQASQHLIRFFYIKKQDIYTHAVAEREMNIRRKEDQIENKRKQIRRLQEERDKILIDISNDKAHGQLQNLDRQIQLLTDTSAQQKVQANRYQQMTEKLNLTFALTEQQFYKNLKQAAKLRDQVQQQQDALEKNRASLELELLQLSTRQEELQNLLTSLQQRQNRLPLEQVRIREALLQKTGLKEKAIPFAAELIQLNPEAAAQWEPYVEQLLRPLAMSLLVEEQHYDRIVEWVHRSKLNGRISFLKVKPPLPLQQQMSKDSLLEKIDIKDSHPFAGWLRQHLIQQYDYICLEGFKTIHRYDRGINSKGLVKNRNFHHRDDHPKRSSSSHYILGWDNKATIAQVKKNLTEVHDAYEQCRRNIKNRKASAKKLMEQRDVLLRFDDVKAFSEIDWKRTAKEIKQNESEKQALLKSSNQLKALRQRQEEVEKTIAELDKNREKLIEDKGRLNDRLEHYRTQLQEAINYLKENPGKISAELNSVVSQYANLEKLTLSNLPTEERRTVKLIRDQLTKQQRLLDKSASTIEKAMQLFINPTPAILEKHPNWTAYTLDLRADVNWLKSFVQLHRKISEEDLPKFQQRFKDWLNERLIFDIANFKTGLDNQETLIREGIETINQSLRNIDFGTNPVTYIQLDMHLTRDQAVREFKQLLRQAMPDPGKLVLGDDKELEASFKRIKRIIEELSANELWRKKVTDVRNWLEFGAIERFRSDDQEFKYYVDSQSLSGGEKAKLAYTILASAIAYQFGIRNDNSQRRSLRFAVIDEAFSKVDEKNALYALELFRQLHLQLMVVTPLDKINLAEPYIETIHYVHNRKNRNSEVFDMPKSVYLAEKEKAKQQQVK